MNKIERIILQKRNGLVVRRNENGDHPLNQIWSVQAELMNLGWILPQKELDKLAKTELFSFNSFLDNVLPVLAKVVGADKNYTAFYKGFPTEVIESTDLELFINAVMHYWSLGTWEPSNNLSNQYAYESHDEYKPLKIVYQDEVECELIDIFVSIVMSNGAVTDVDRDTLHDVWVYFPLDVKKRLAELDPPFKENLVTFIRFLELDGIVKKMKTVTDVLRYSVFVSGGDITLSCDTPFMKFKRADRRHIMALIETLKPKKQSHEVFVLEEMQARKQKWLRLGEGIHPGEYAKRYPFASSMFKQLRSTKVKTWQGKVNSAMACGEVLLAVDLLSQKPGVFARSLDHVLREFPKHSIAILDKFVGVSGKISASVLIQLYGHFKKRLECVGSDENTSLVIIPGQRTKHKFLSRDVKAISETVLEMVMDRIWTALYFQFSEMDDLGHVAIDPALKTVPVPFAMRDIQEGTHVLVRGTRLPLGDKDTVRAYVHWFDKYGKIDIDLSAQTLNEDFNHIDTISFQGLYSSFGNRGAVVHSGDVRWRVGACAEYIDVNIDLLKETKARYVVFDVRNYEGDFLSDIEGAVVGFMMRDKPEQNEHFVPKSIKEAMPLNIDQQASNVFAIDLETREYIWIQLDDAGTVSAPNTITNHKFKEIIHALDHKMSLFELMELHAYARGESITELDDDMDLESFDTILGKDLAFQYATVQSEYMASKAK